LSDTEYVWNRAVSLQVPSTFVLEQSADSRTKLLIVVLSTDLAAGIRRVKGVKKLGVRLGNWLTAEQAQGLWQAPDREKVKGKRDRALLGLLLACGLRRHEVAKLTLGHLQQREGHWAIVDLRGKAGHVRTIPVPDWVHDLLADWMVAAGITMGTLFRRVRRAGKVWGDAVTEKLVWHVVKEFAAKTGIRELAPHDLCSGRVGDDSPAENSSTHKSLASPCVSAALRKTHPLANRLKPEGFVRQAIRVKSSLATRPRRFNHAKTFPSVPFVAVRLFSSHRIFRR
jgi:hypothetical protein